MKWNDGAQKAFEELKRKLAQEITLKFPSFDKPFVLTTDASDYCIGGVLQQEDSAGKLRPLTYLSRTLNSAERNYSAVEREALAVI